MRGMRILTLTLAAVVATLCCATAGTLSRSAPSRELHTNTRDVGAADEMRWSVQTSGIDTNLRGVNAVYISDAIATRHPADSAEARHIAVWACGSNGAILFSSDEGKTWKRLHVTGGDALDFRGIVAFDETTAYVMSSGEGDKSRIYKTTDGGENWKLEFTDKRPSFFLDALVCHGDCYALSDPVNGKFVLVRAQNGENWKELPSDGMPAALPGEGAFAASGTALAIDWNGEIYFGTGGGKAARVFHSPDFGKTWTVAETPIASGNASSGIFSIVLVAKLLQRSETDGPRGRLFAGRRKDLDSRCATAWRLSFCRGASVWRDACRRPHRGRHLLRPGRALETHRFSGSERGLRFGHLQRMGRGRERHHRAPGQSHAISDSERHPAE